MRRLAVLTVAMVLLCGIPQAMAQRRFQFGGKIGPSFTDIALDEDDGQTYERRIAGAGGGFVKLPLEMLLSTKEICTFALVRMAK